MVTTPSPDLDAPSPSDLALIGASGGRRLPRWPLAVGAVALVAAIAWAAWPADAAYETVEATRGDLKVDVTAVGTLEPVTTVEIGSEVNGKVARVLADENQAVRAGELLAEIDPEPYAAAVAQARAKVAAAVAALEQAKISAQQASIDRDRSARLLERGAAAAADVQAAGLTADGSDAAVDARRADLDQARASLRDAEQDLAKTRIVSPLDGVVLQRDVEPGQTVVSSLQAATLFEVASDPSSLRLDVGVDEADVSQVRAGQAASFTVAAWPDRVFAAEVVSVDLAPDPDADVVQYDAELRVDNRGGALHPGMTATASIEVNALEDVVLVPALALRWSPGGGWGPPDASRRAQVWTLVDGEPAAVPVDIAASDGSRVAVRGLDAGVQVIVGGGQ